MDAVENDEAVKATTSSDDLYLDSYERYAGMSSMELVCFSPYSMSCDVGVLIWHTENRPDTSQLQKAVNSGRGLP